MTNTVTNQFTEVSKTDFFFHNCQLLALGTMAETRKPFSKQMLVIFLLRKEEQEKSNIETYFRFPPHRFQI